MRNAFRLTTRIILVVMLTWGCIQSCLWTGDLTNERGYYMYKQYQKNKYQENDQQNYQESIDNQEVENDYNKRYYSPY